MRILILFFCVLISSPYERESWAQTIFVGDGEAYSTISEAVAIAASVDTIYVRPGHFAEETIVISSPVVLYGIDYPVLDGQMDRQLITVAADSVTISGFKLQNVGVSYVEDRAAIKVEAGRDCRIVDNILENNFFGIYLAKTEGCRISNNTISGSGSTESGSGNGIHLWYSKAAVISGNVVSNHRDGIYLEFVEDTDVFDNLSQHNRRYGLHFMFSDRNTYRGNHFRENAAGVAVMYTKNVVMDGNTFEHNWGTASFGLLLKDITDSRVINNRFIKNTIGVYAEASDRIAFEYNTFDGNGWAVKIMANCVANRFEHNNIINNTFDVATNSRSTEVTFANNHWDQYDGYDLDRNGVGDIAYRPVRFFSLIVENNESAQFLLRSFFVTLLDSLEQLIPAVTPASIQDLSPQMKMVKARD